VRSFGIDPLALGLIEHTEVYEDVGEIRAYVMDLEARWKDEEERHVVYVGPGDGVTLAEFELPAPPAIVWDYITTPAKRAMWQAGTLRVEEETEAGLRGVGTKNHCVHGDYTIEEEILDWKPFRYYTDRSVMPFGTVLFTAELRPGPDGQRTMLAMRVKPEGGPEEVARLQAMAPELQDGFDLNVQALSALMRRVQAEAGERAETLAT